MQKLRVWKSTAFMSLAGLSALLCQALAHAGALDDCGRNAPARELAGLIMSDPLQQRGHLRCDGLLATIADAKAREMARLEQVAHLGTNAANARLVEAGYPLSGIYPRLLENNVEAVAGGIRAPADVWSAFKRSQAHRMHLLAEHEFYRLQDEIGVGFHSDPSSPHVEYWVVYIAHRGGDETYRGRIANSKD